MAGRTLFRLCGRFLSPSISPSYQIIQTHSQIPSKYALTESPPTIISQRSFSWWGSHSRKPDPNATHTFKQDKEKEKEEEHEEHGNERSDSLITESETFGSGFDDVTNVLENSLVTESASHGIEIGWHTPVDCMIAFFDGFHNLTGLPWWLSIVASTVVIRLAVLPVSILQIIKSIRILKMQHILLPFLPMPRSEDFLQQYARFRHQRRAMGCPTFLWFFASPAIQMPVFFCSMLAVRWMCMDLHPGFDSGGTMWFVDLTEHVHGPLGALFPFSTAGVFLLNVQLSFGGLKNLKASGLFDLIRKWYRIYLQCLAVPVFIVGFYMPQGVLIFMLSNSTFTTMQILLQRYLSSSMMSGLSADPKNPKTAESIRHLRNGETTDLSSADLLKLAAQHVAGGQLERALQVLRAAIEKDPERSEPYLAMGTIQHKRKLCDEAVKQFELAIAKAKNDDVLVAAHLYAGISLLSQEKMVEAIAHLRKITAFEEPTEPKSKSLYYQGLVLLASTLFNDGKKDEAAQYLQIAAKYDPSVNIYLQQCEETKDIEPGQ